MAGADVDSHWQLPARWLQEVDEEDISPGAGATLSFGWLGYERQEFCKTAPTPPPQLNSFAPYPANEYHAVTPDSVLTMFQEWRGESLFTPVVKQCAIIGAQVGEFGSCQTSLTAYASSLLIFTVPVVVSLLFVFVWQICCCVTCCRFCRRVFPCNERRGPRPAYWWQRIAGATSVLVGSGVVGLSAIICFVRSEEIAGGVADMLCQLLTLADEALNGSEGLPDFLGIDVGIYRLRDLRGLLDVDGEGMTDVRAILDETSSFTAVMDEVLARIGHMERVLAVIGQRKIKDHACAFCQLALGGENTTAIGLLQELRHSIQESPADAMRAIQATASSMLTGRSLVEVSTAVRRGVASLQTFKRGLAGAWVQYGIMSFRQLVAALEDARHTIFRVMSAFSIIHAIAVSTAAVWYAGSSKAKFPSSSPSCITWFCGFCVLSFSMGAAGGLLLVVMPISDMCNFWRYELFLYDGVANYYRELDLVDHSDPAGLMDFLAVNVARTCVTPNGTGVILDALQLSGPLRFQTELDNHFEKLDAVAARGNLDILRFQEFVELATTFGGLFLLDPDRPLELDSTGAPVMNGSSVDPYEQLGTDGETYVYGLNQYALHIAEPGQFSFAHGTAGGGTLITATTPTEADVRNLLVTQQNALFYARLKEQLLSEADLFRCDGIDASLQITERTCDFEAYRQSLVSWAELTRAAAERLQDETAMAQQLIGTDLKDSLDNLLSEVRTLRRLFRCRFLWKRWEEFETSLCGVAVPGMVQSSLAWIVLSFSALLLVVVHYKMWRHFLDNRVVGVELERFSKKYGGLYASVEQK